LLVGQNFDLSAPRNFSTLCSIRSIDELVNIDFFTICDRREAAEPGLSTEGLVQLRDLNNHIKLLSEVSGFLSSLDLIVDVTDDCNQQVQTDDNG